MVGKVAKSKSLMVMFLIVLVSAPAFGQIGAISFLGLEATNEAVAEESTPKTMAVTGPWGRLAPGHRDRIAPVIIAQLNHHSTDEVYENIAHQEYDDDYLKWKALGLPQETWPIYQFNEIFDDDTRRLFLCVYTKMRYENFWSQIITVKRSSPKSPWPGFYVMPKGGEAGFKRYLEGLGYGDWFKASRKPRWGLRSPKTGYEFHIIQCPLDWDQRFVETHIDSYNPGTSRTGLEVLAPGVHWANYAAKGLKHVSDDKWWPNEKDVPGRLKAALRAQGLVVPDVDETTYDSGVTMSDFTKWKTPDKHFGYLWINTRQNTAGWWTTYEGARNFSKVTCLGSAKDDGRVSYRLDYYNGFLLFRMKGTSCEASWYKENENRWIDVTGNRVMGHAYRDGRDME